MSKKVLVISSSPRRGGNSDWLCDQFVLGAKAAGNTTEKVFLGDLKLNFCTGCGYCNEHHKCPQNDDMANLLDQIIQSDVILLATPVYFYSMCAQLKVMIDRICPRYTEISDKKFYLIASAAETHRGALDGTVAGFRGMLECLPGAVEAGILYGLGIWQVDEAKSTPLGGEAYDMGLKV